MTAHTELANLDKYVKLLDEKNASILRFIDQVITLQEENDRLTAALAESEAFIDRITVQLCGRSHEKTHP
jgi:hypothetical protein